MDEQRWPLTSAAIRAGERRATPRRVKVAWPGGTYDFEVEVESIEPARERDGWYWLRGLVVKPEGDEHHRMREFFVHPDGDGYALIPKIP